MMKTTASNVEEVVNRYNQFINKVEIGHLPFVKKERIDANFEKYGEAMNTLAVYPDILADLMTPRKSHFSLFFEQRMVLRSMARYRQSFFTFTRGFSKSFLAFFKQYATCMFIPRYQSFVVSGTKSQAAQIARGTVINDLWVKFPLLANEMQKFRVAGKQKDPYQNAGDSVVFNFTNGSQFDVIGGQVRGRRKNTGLFEEVITLDPTYINESVLPTLQTSRLMPDGSKNPYEIQGQKIYITSAGWSGTFAHDKVVETLCLSLLEPTKYIVMGGSYEILLMHDRMPREAISEIISSPTYKPEEIDREYRSIWSTTTSGAMFQPNSIVAMRKMKRAEYKAIKELDKDFYVVAADLAYDGAADTAVVVIRVSPGEYRFSYRFVNLFTIDIANYEVVSNILKQTCAKYKARLLVYDANGVGATLREHLNKPNTTSDGTYLPAYGILNPPSNIAPQLRVVREKNHNICYEIKSGGQKGSEIHGIFLGKMTNGSIRFLVKSNEALNCFSKVKSFALGSSTVKDKYMKPYLYTDLLELELKNLDFKQDLTNDNMIRVIRRDEKIQKDFFSAAEYGIYAVVQEMELPYYKRKRALINKKLELKTSGTINSNSRQNRRSSRDLNSRRRKR